MDSPLYVQEARQLEKAEIKSATLAHDRTGLVVFLSFFFF